MTEKERTARKVGIPRSTVTEADSDGSLIRGRMEGLSAVESQRAR